MLERAFNPFQHQEAESTARIDEIDMQVAIAGHEKNVIKHLTPRERMKDERARNDKEELARLQRDTEDMSRARHMLEKDPRFSDTVGAEAAYVEKLWFDSLVDEHGNNRFLIDRFEIYKEVLEKSKDTFVRIIRERGKVFPISGYTPGDIFDSEIARMGRLLQ